MIFIGVDMCYPDIFLIILYCNRCNLMKSDVNEELASVFHGTTECGSVNSKEKTRMGASDARDLSALVD